MFADLLADEVASARAAAARCFGYLGDRSALPLLRFKLHIGDDDPDVLCDTMTALLQLGGAEEMELVCAYLDRSPELQRCAVLALGASERADALEPLTAWLAKATEADDLRTATLAIAMLRREEAFACLIDAVANGSLDLARHAMAAIATHPVRGELGDRLRTALAERALRGDGDLRSEIG